MTNSIITLYSTAWSDYVSTSSTHDSDNIIITSAKITAMKIYSDGLPYKQKYWQTLYLAVCSEYAVGGILNWWISVLCGEKSMLVV